VPFATLHHNGYLLTPDRIKRLNRAGLDYLQISIDNVMPDETSKKSLKGARSANSNGLASTPSSASPSIQCLAPVSGIRRTPFVIGGRARELGFTSTVVFCTIMRVSSSLSRRPQEDVYARSASAALKTSLFSFAHFDSFQENIHSRPAQFLALPRRWTFSLHL